MHQLSPEVAKKIMAYAEFDALKEHIHACIAELDSVSTIPETADYDKTSRGRAEAVKTLKQILAPFFVQDDIEIGDRKAETLHKLGLG